MYVAIIYILYIDNLVSHYFKIHVEPKTSVILWRRSLVIILKNTSIDCVFIYLHESKHFKCSMYIYCIQSIYLCIQSANTCMRKHNFVRYKITIIIMIRMSIFIQVWTIICSPSSNFSTLKACSSHAKFACLNPGRDGSKSLQEIVTTPDLLPCKRSAAVSTVTSSRR